MKPMEGPTIMRNEIRYALNNMKNGKAAGPDNISKEMLNALEDIGVDKLESIMNKMYDSGIYQRRYQDQSLSPYLRNQEQQNVNYIAP